LNANKDGLAVEFQLLSEAPCLPLSLKGWKSIQPDDDVFSEAVYKEMRCQVSLR